MQNIGPFALAAGALAVASVFAGDAMKVPGFSTATGFWGTHFLDGLFYCVSRADFELAVVSLFWFGYGGLIGGAIGLFVTGGRKPPRASSPSEVGSSNPSSRA